MPATTVTKTPQSADELAKLLSQLHRTTLQPRSPWQSKSRPECCS